MHNCSSLRPRLVGERIMEYIHTALQLESSWPFPTLVGHNAPLRKAYQRDGALSFPFRLPDMLLPDTPMLSSSAQRCSRLLASGCRGYRGL